MIPLSMLFAFGMMKTFGIDGNLMSLGAIDFGMIVDSAVIIVEAVVTHINTGHFSQPESRAAYLAQCQNGGAASPFALTQKQMDEEVHFSASRIRQSAAFGEIMIMIVYIPLMTLGGNRRQDVPSDGTDRILCHSGSLHSFAYLCADGKFAVSESRKYITEKHSPTA